MLCGSSTFIQASKGGAKSQIQARIEEKMRAGDRLVPNACLKRDSSWDLETLWSAGRLIRPMEGRVKLKSLGETGKRLVKSIPGFSVDRLKQKKKKNAKSTALICL